MTKLRLTKKDGTVLVADVVEMTLSMMDSTECVVLCDGKHYFLCGYFLEDGEEWSFMEVNKGEGQTWHDVAWDDAIRYKLGDFLGIIVSAEEVV
jgi:hypothetical protein